MSRKTLGTHLTECREHVGLTRGQVAEKIGVTEQAVGFWERDDRVPDWPNLQRLAEIYKLDDAAIAEAVRLSAAA